MRRCCCLTLREVLQACVLILACGWPCVVYLYVGSSSWWFYISLTCGVFLLVTLFPQIALYLHSKPFYYEDLQEPRFQVLFLRLQQVFTLLAVVPSFIFYLERWQAPEEAHWYTLFALWGGYNAFLTQILDPLGKVLLHIVDYVRINSPRLQPQPPQAGLEALTLDVLELV